MIRATAALALLLGLGGCLRPGDCSALASGLAGSLACRAGASDKLAALELGKQYEDGLGVPQNLRRAAELYRTAATTTSGTIYVYSPPVGKNGRGTVIPVRAGPDQPGLAEASFRLALLHLRGAGVRLDYAKATKLLENAAAAGFEPARTKLMALRAAPRA